MLFWIFIASIVVLYVIVRLGMYYWENYILSREERWQRKYDRRMKKHFKSWG
ncbi:MAG: hypothetical protein AAF558_07855 [Verrucomicrobiota bacterium]